ncbi:MAG: TonB-dependent receptor [Verrucomicrobia bacterium]|nr:TonB-dependent receptor [Verrucomicrobiota bacterium]
MNTIIATPRLLPLRTQCFLSALLTALLLAGGAVPSALAAVSDAASGVISGNVSNSGTGNLLEGARVEVPQLGLVALTDNTGRFVLSGVPAGAHELVASYTGLDPLKASVTVAAGQRAIRDFDLTSGIYQLDAFKVTGEREGNALAITAQRNAPNVKNIVAMDAYGNLPNMNASELAVLLPGVAGNVNDEGNLNAFTIRGMGPGLNTITIDGALMGSQGGGARETRIHTITGSMFEQLELVKGHTPDKGMDSLGGTVNLKSRSPLSMKERRRTTYNFSGRLAPAGTEQIPLRAEHRFHPILNVAHQQLFDLGGGERNLGVAVNLFYSEQAVGYFSTTRDFQNTPNQPAYLWDYGTEDNYNNRKQSSVNAKFDFRLSPRTKVSFNGIYNDAMERFRLRYNFRAFTGNATTVPNATTSGVIPGFTARVTAVRPVAAATIDISSRMSQFYHRQRHFDLGAEHEFGPLQLDYNAVRSIDRIRSGGGDGGVLVNRVTGVGWILDRTQSDLYPRFIQTAGPDIGNPASYRPNSYNFADTRTNHEILQLSANARYKLPTEMTLYVKTGARLREELVGNESKSKRFNFLGTNSAQLPTDPTIKTFGDHKTGLKIPGWNANAIARGRTPLDTALWTEDRYFYESSKYTGSRAVTETVTAGYVMAQGKIGSAGFLGGVRTEKTEDDSWGWVRARVASTAAQQLADPVGAAQRDYANTLRKISGSYTKSFPSAHLTYDLTRSFRGRVSWSTSFGRPPLSNLQPNESISETNQTLTISNPSLRPQTAENWDAALEYYFEPVGSLSVGWFHKTIEDYFVSGIQSGTVGTGADNGYGGEYAGFTILTRSNLGTAVVQGWEFSYQQQFTFLPGLLKGLGLSVNYTLLDTHGNFGGTVTRTTGQVPGFIPRSGNVSLSWRYRGFGTRITANRVGDYIRNFTAVGSGANQYTNARMVVNVGVAYQYKPWLSFSIDAQNVFNEVQSWYRGIPDQISQVYIPGPTVTFGVSGRF